MVHCWAVPDTLEQKVPIASRTSGVFADALLVKSMMMRVKEWEFILRIGIPNLFFTLFQLGLFSPNYFYYLPFQVVPDKTQIRLQ